MAAFDISTNPRSLSLKPGSVGSIFVVVSNRLGRPLNGLVEGVLTPPSTARWLESPKDLQRRYEADPAATVNYEFKVNVPKDAPAQATEFRASVRDAMAPDDTRVEGQTVAINVTPDAAPPVKPKNIPWWIWLIVGAVLLGVGSVVYLIVRPRGVPNVIGMTPEKATAKLKAAGFAPINVRDTVVNEAKDSSVANQVPAPGSELPEGPEKGNSPATIVVNRLSGVSKRPDGILEMAVWRPSEGRFYILPKTGATVSTTDWGVEGDVPVVRDYDGDGIADLAVWRPQSGRWLVIKSTDGAQLSRQWGETGDVPVPTDYDGDKRADMAVWRPSNGHWYVIKSSNDSTVSRQWGLHGDVPAPGDYDGDGRADFMVWRPAPSGIWWLIRSSDGGHDATNWGTYGDLPVAGDYDGDKRTDLAVWRPSTGEWLGIRSRTKTQFKTTWGEPNDKPAPGDFDGDGRTDLTFWRPATGMWWISKTKDGAQTTQQLGLDGDIPTSGDFNAVAP